MPNWLYLVTNLFYELGLAVWIGGAIALGALAAPVLFGALPRQQAGSIFGPTLRRFARLRLVAIVFTIIAAAIKHAVWERGNATPWIAIRWAALVFLAAVVLYEIGFLERAMERHRGEARFQTLHRRSEALMKLSLLAALVAMFLS